MVEPSAGDYPWLILHKGHPAWYQRALMAGDFSPGTQPQPNYVLTLEGTQPEPYAVPICGTCGVEPKVEQLEPLERETGRRDWLDRFRLSPTHPDHVPWNRGGRTDPRTCYVCNTPRERISRRGAYVLICDRCEEHLARGGV